MVNTRRSLGDALAMTPDKLAFIQGAGTKSEQGSAPIEASQSKPVVEELRQPTIEVEPMQSETARQKPRPTKSQNRSDRGREDARDSDDEAMLGVAKLLAPLTTRLQPKTANALKRAGLEQKLRGRHPSTVQEIAEEAIQTWLRDAGYLH